MTQLPSLDEITAASEKRRCNWRGFHPVLSFADKTGLSFINVGGQPLPIHTDDNWLNFELQHVWLLARSASTLLGLFTVERLEACMTDYNNALREIRTFLLAGEAHPTFVWFDGSTENFSADYLMDECSVLAMLDQGEYRDTLRYQIKPERRRELYTMRCLILLDEVVVDFRNARTSSVGLAISAAMWHQQGVECIPDSSNVRSIVLRDLAITAARARHASDPKQADKKEVKECWRLWVEKPSRYRSKAAFARDMLGKYESLTSAKVVEDWVREWERERK